MTSTSTPSANSLREAMVREVVANRAHVGVPLSPAVEKALAQVPREAFLPGLDLKEVYTDQAVVTKRDNKRGVALSSVSAPTVIALMLDRADIRPGHRVLEIGSGGYNAALISELVGADGQVTSIDIDAEVIDRAHRCLVGAGYTDVHLGVADGEYGFADRAPFDRIVITAGAWDVPAAWAEQLVPGGRLVVPKRIRGLTRCLTLEHHGQGLWSALAQDMCGFVRITGAGEHWEQMPYLNDTDGRRVGLRLEDGPDVDVQPLREALIQEPTTVWAEVLIAYDEATDAQDLWLATVIDDWALLTADPGAVKAKIVKPTWNHGTPALIAADGASFAYRTLRRHPDLENRWQFGAIGHGPSGPDAAQQLCALMEEWDRHHRGGPGPDITLVPAHTPDDQLPSGRVVNKRHTRMVLHWATTP
ncbi:methyltransferase, FxLD system [Nocardiopsis metallicus]|uniref:Protein-L-isoaspartate O-methyltransferase n=1 Tax=Nocardiopsis metallicus TaxID=179819 RepID=A0A840WEZ5_9ACTN|nr:methyltransferase, FxLD system [Nocardiopsis metallicus]MBB5494802.1 protein-L-isoaspartate(D-aspartate) O-methyltransferase [Nocardiopsis metallicus]